LFLLHLIRAHVNFQAAKKPTRERRIQTKPRERERERERASRLHESTSVAKTATRRCIFNLPERGAPYPRSPLIWENKPRFCNGYHLAASGGLEGTL